MVAILENIARVLIRIGTVLQRLHASARRLPRDLPGVAGGRPPLDSDEYWG